MNKKIEFTVKAISLVAALAFAVGCGKAEAKKAMRVLEETYVEIAEKIKEDTDKSVAAQSTSDPEGSHEMDFTDPMYDIDVEEEGVFDSTAPSIEIDPQKEITQEDLERAIAALEEQLK